MSYGMKELAEAEGLSEMELLENATFDSVAAGICPECGYTTNVEPDQDQGWCEECETGSVKSCLVLMGMI